MGVAPYVHVGYSSNSVAAATLDQLSRTTSTCEGHCADPALGATSSSFLPFVSNTSWGPGFDLGGTGPAVEPPLDPRYHS
jgi:hypothetical protein